MKPADHHPARTAEWLTSGVLLAIAFILVLPGDTLSISVSFTAFVALGVDEVMLAVPLTIIALMRMVALFINGRWGYSPMFRLIGAALGIAAFGMLTILFTYPHFFIGTPASLASGAYACLCGADIFAAYRSGRDYGEMNPQSFDWLQKTLNKWRGHNDRVAKR